jgi:hypothetical protein
MRSRVASVAGFLVFGCAGIAWAAAPVDLPTKLIRIALPSAGKAIRAIRAIRAILDHRGFASTPACRCTRLIPICQSS